MRPYKGKVVIGTFFYKQQANQSYIASLISSVLALERLGIKHDEWLICGNFHMEIVVNETLSKFLRSDADDIILIDSDESWVAEHALRLLMHEEEIVCGVYPLTKPNAREYPVVLTTDEDGSHLGRMLPDGNCLLEAERIPGGFIKISKTALQKWVEANPDRWLYSEEGNIYTFFLNEVRGHTLHGMDYCFGDAMKACGVRLWVDPICDITHWGIYPYKLTLDEHLRMKKRNQESQWAFDEVARMAKEVEARRG